MTTKLLVEIPRLQLSEIQKLAAESYAGLLFATRDFIRSRWGADALRDYEERLARDHAECLKARGITSALDFVKALATHSVNVYGSQIEIEGDDTHASLECKSCGVCNAIREMKEAHKAEIGEKDYSPLRYFELMANEMGFDFKGEICGDGFCFTVSRAVPDTEEYVSLD